MKQDIHSRRRDLIRLSEFIQDQFADVEAAIDDGEEFVWLTNEDQFMKFVMTEHTVVVGLASAFLKDRADQIIENKDSIREQGVMLIGAENYIRAAEQILAFFEPEVSLSALNTQ